MNITTIAFYGLLLIPLAAILLAGYGKFKVGSFFGVALALGAMSLFFTYLVVDLTAALWQLGFLVLGILLFVGTIGLFGDKFSYRSPMLLLASIGLAPLGLFIGIGLPTPLYLYGGLIALNLIFAFVLYYLRRGSSKPIGQEEDGRAKHRFMLTVPAALSVVILGLVAMDQIAL